MGEHAEETGSLHQDGWTWAQYWCWLGLSNAGTECGSADWSAGPWPQMGGPHIADWHLGCGGGSGCGCSGGRVGKSGWWTAGRLLKRRFCTSYPDVASCRFGARCDFPHSREEIQVSLLSEEEERQDAAAMTDEFLMYRYKTRWCPIPVPHAWQTCVYAHNHQDARRPVEAGYGSKPCSHWSKKSAGADYSKRCPLGLRCP